MIDTLNVLIVGLSSLTKIGCEHGQLILTFVASRPNEMHVKFDNFHRSDYIFIRENASRVFGLIIIYYSIVSRRIVIVFKYQLGSCLAFQADHTLHLPDVTHRAVWQPSK